MTRNTYHPNGSITYWSVYEQRWVRDFAIPDREFAAMCADERARAIRHLAQNLKER